jgi:drug/metabolite transporter (DMT)-like permease
LAHLSGKGIPFSPFLVLLAGILIVSTSSILIRFAQKEASSFTIAAYRLTFATLILLPIVLKGRRQEILRLRRSQWLLVILSGLFLALHFATWIKSLELTTVASSVVLVSTAPIWVALLSPFVLRERPSRWGLIGMVVTLSGAILVGLNETCSLSAGGLVCPPMQALFSGGMFFGNVLALVGAFGAAGYLLAGRWLRPGMSLIVYIFLVYGTAAVFLLGVAFQAQEPMAGFSAWTWVCLLGLAVGPQLLGHTAFNYGLRYLSAAFVSVSLLGEPIGTTILALVILREIPSPLEIVGGVTILIGILLASREQGRRREVPAAAEEEAG